MGAGSFSVWVSAMTGFSDTTLKTVVSLTRYVTTCQTHCLMAGKSSPTWWMAELEKHGARDVELQLDGAEVFFNG